MTMNEYLADPADVLFFRGNASFSIGAWHTEGVFPPYPSTLQGFIRSKILFDNKLLPERRKIPDRKKILALTPLLADLVGDVVDVGDDREIKIDAFGPFLYHEKAGIAIPPPKDIFLFDGALRSAFYGAGAGTFQSDLDFPLLDLKFPSGKAARFPSQEYLFKDELAVYRRSLCGYSIGKKELVMTESRTGISLDNEARTGINLDHVAHKTGNRKVKEGHFYVTPYIRLCDGVKIYFCVDKNLNDGPFKFGSEAHLVSVKRQNGNGATTLEKLFAETREDIIKSIVANRTFRLVLLQPGIFKDGWLPYARKKKNGGCFLEGPAGMELQLLFAFTGDPVPISGYSFEKGRTEQEKIVLKPMRKAVPAGAVYLFRIPDNAGPDAVRGLVRDLDNNKIPFEQYHKMGFSHTFMAAGPQIV